MHEVFENPREIFHPETRVTTRASSLRFYPLLVFSTYSVQYCLKGSFICQPDFIQFVKKSYLKIAKARICYVSKSFQSDCEYLKAIFKKILGKAIWHQKFAHFCPAYLTAGKSRAELNKFLVLYGFAK